MLIELRSLDTVQPLRFYVDVSVIINFAVIEAFPIETAMPRTQPEPKRLVTREEILERAEKELEKVREFYVEREMRALIKEELAECYRRERINHLRKCFPLAQEYLRKVLKWVDVPQSPLVPTPPRFNSTTTTMPEHQEFETTRHNGIQ